MSRLPGKGCREERIRMDLVWGILWAALKVLELRFRQWDRVPQWRRMILMLVMKLRTAFVAVSWKVRSV